MEALEAAKRQPSSSLSSFFSIAFAIWAGLGMGSVGWLGHGECRVCVLESFWEWCLQTLPDKANDALYPLVCMFINLCHWGIQVKTGKGRSMMFTNKINCTAILWHWHIWLTTAMSCWIHSDTTIYETNSKCLLTAVATLKLKISSQILSLLSRKDFSWMFSPLAIAYHIMACSFSHRNHIKWHISPNKLLMLNF